MSDDDLRQHGIRLASRPAVDMELPEEPSGVPPESAARRVLQQTNRVCGFAGLGIGVALFFTDLPPAGLAIIFASVAVLLAEFEDLVCGPSKQRAR